MSWVSEVVNGVKHVFGGGGSSRPMPGALQPPGTGVNTGSNYGSAPINTGPQTLPIASGGSPFTASQQAQLQSAFTAAGVWDTIKGLGGDVWGAIASVLPKNADGSVDWGKVGSDVVGWVKDNKDTILQGLSAYNSYARSQKSDQYAQKALDLATKSYDAKQPLRDAGMAGMLNPGANAPDLSSLRTQGQTGLSLQAPAPLPLATGNLGNAQAMANGPQSSNPFTRGLPLVSKPAVPSPPAPTAPPLPIAPPLRAAPARPVY